MCGGWYGCVKAPSAWANWRRASGASSRPMKWRRCGSTCVMYRDRQPTNRSRACRQEHHQTKSNRAKRAHAAPAAFHRARASARVAQRAEHTQRVRRTKRRPPAVAASRRVNTRRRTLRGTARPTSANRAQAAIATGRRPTNPARNADRTAATIEALLSLLNGVMKDSGAPRAARLISARRTDAAMRANAEAIAIKERVARMGAVTKDSARHTATAARVHPAGAAARRSIRAPDGHPTARAVNPEDVAAHHSIHAPGGHPMAGAAARRSIHAPDGRPMAGAAAHRSIHAPGGRPTEDVAARRSIRAPGGRPTAGAAARRSIRAPGDHPTANAAAHRSIHAHAAAKDAIGPRMDAAAPDSREEHEETARRAATLAARRGRISATIDMAEVARRPAARGPELQGAARTGVRITIRTGVRITIRTAGQARHGRTPEAGEAQRAIENHPVRARTGGRARRRTSRAFVQAVPCMDLIRGVCMTR